MTSIAGIDHLNLHVHDLERALAFYRGLFDFEIREDGRDDDPRWLILGHQGRAYLALHEKPGYRASHRPGINHWGFNIEDFDALLVTLEARQVPLLYTHNSEDGVIRYPDSRSVYINDPDGHEIELTETFGGGLG